MGLCSVASFESLSAAWSITVPFKVKKKYNKAGYDLGCRYFVTDKKVFVDQFSQALGLAVYVLPSSTHSSKIWIQNKVMAWP